MAGIGMGGSGLAEAYVMRKMYKEKLHRQEAASATANKHNDDAEIKNSVGGGKPNDAAAGESSGGGCFFSSTTSSGGARVSDENMSR
ncbi:unnamed protein product [Linum trigynum]|uniref:Uncharacterized protein n=1 Tax=Linum trigynum TaxID=586398 RepID=A0AAV2CA93_9ROSI